MNNSSQTGLWAVRWFHKNGYQAPYQTIEAKNKEEAIFQAGDIKTRLRDFECWSWKLTKLPYSKNDNGKWVLNGTHPFF